MRQNLDPLNEHTDFECEQVLAKVAKDTPDQTENEGADSDSCIDQATNQPSHSLWKLDTQIEAGGRNLSQGQRQLVGMARALLRKSPIIILDEVMFLSWLAVRILLTKFYSLKATASIDLRTALQIQGILRTEMAQSTVITIAHRAEAVQGADRIVKMSEGRIVEE